MSSLTSGLTAHSPELARPRILLIDLGSQYTKVIARTLRQLGYRVALFSPKDAAKWLRTNKVGAIILSGGDKSVYDQGSPRVPREVYDAHVPIFGICFGMHSVVNDSGGKVESVQELREYGKGTILTAHSPLFVGLPHRLRVWNSHGDTVTRAPNGWRVTAQSEETSAIAALEDPVQGIYLVQFHPEVTHTTHGKTILKRFLEDIALCKKDWKPASIVADIQKLVLDALRKNGKAVIGFSGGVDSTTLSRILSPILGKRLLGIVIDGGQFRENEIVEIKRHAHAAGIKIRIINARGLFLKAMRGLTDAEQIRKAFKKIYKSILMKEGRRFGAKFIIQGTLAPDMIESGATGGDLIKSHHNVGLKTPGFVQLHPFADLFKYEVYALAKKLSLPESVWTRQPFPGPGLFLRGALTKKQQEIVRWADARVTEILKKHKLYRQYSQTLTWLGEEKVVGIKGDGRVYKPFAFVRAVKTLDFMTAEGIRIPDKPWREIQTALSQHPEIVGAVNDDNNKPPRTTERI